MDSGTPLSCGQEGISPVIQLWWKDFKIPRGPGRRSANNFDETTSLSCTSVGTEVITESVAVIPLPQV